MNEDELRAALRAGEGDGVAAGAIIGRAEALRHSRRTRLLTAAATVLAVGALGGGAFAVHNAGGGGESAGMAEGKAARGADAPGTAAPGTAAPGAAAGGAPGATTCPARADNITFPAPGGTGHGGPLFTGRIVSITLCGYRGTRPADRALRAGTVLTGARARALAAAVDSAPTGYRAISCPLPPASTAVVLYARTPQGEQPPVLIDLDCGVNLTDGTAARWIWTPPAGIASTLAALTR